MESRFIERVRAFEHKILDNLDRVTCPTHLSLGAEWVSANIAKHIRKDDYLFSTHRNHAHYLAKGGSEDSLWDEILGLDSGLNGGHAGSQSICDPSINFYASSIVGGSIGVAVGAALALKGTGYISVAVFGDAATEQGVFWESVSFAVVKQLPLLLICENNGLSINVPIAERQPHKESRPAALWFRVTSFGLRNFEGTPENFATAFKFARDEPIFMECQTQREGDHCYFPTR